MKVETGSLYHIKDEFFDIVNDPMLMSNHERGKKRPTYFAIRDEKILWFIPLSSRVEKYDKIVEQKVKKLGVCRTILIRDVMNRKHAILLQNAFPTLEKYIDHVHTIKNKPAKVVDSVKEEILTNFQFLLSMKLEGNNLFFTDIDRIKAIMLEELEESVVK